MSRGSALGKSLLLIILIIILVLGGLLWFDFLGIIHAKKIFAPVYRLFGLAPQTSEIISNPDSLVQADLDNDRFRKRLEALDIRTEELDKRESDLVTAENSNSQMAQELEDRRNSLDEQEKTLNSRLKKYDDRSANIEQIVADLNGMQPVKAVGILNEMDDQDVIDVLRKATEVAQRNGSASLVAYWLSLMPAERAAVIERKMANKPLHME